ncbi:hypothetical protein [Horticoccus sp. 23ND18S-11]|uniref:hypothetical protein n=1 Tax=Horticoccus sp. 23ND18S-11 TaxID=3391832 RepID=UPI0039C8FBBA
MATLGIEVCDTAFQAAVCAHHDPKALAVADAAGVTDWPGFAYFDGQKYAFGRAAEDQWFVHPRRVAHTFWARLAHEPSTIGPLGKAAPFSELAYHFFSDFARRATGLAAADKLVLAVPGAYLKDPATEEEKIGLLLGMVGELKLPLAGVIDYACAALCDPRAQGFNPALPVVVINLDLEGADLTLLAAEEHLERKDFIHLPQSGYAQLLKHLTATMGNRFLRHTAFDILEDGRIEQTFFRQTKDFLLSGAPEHRFQINTAARNYELLAKREQLATDAQGFVNTLVQGVQAFLQNSSFPADPCTIALTDRTGRLPGLETRLRAAGFHRIIRLPAGAAAAGAACVGENRLKATPDLADVPVETAIPVALARRSTASSWEARLQKLRLSGPPRPAPTHVILEGIGHALGSSSRFTIGSASLDADLALPESFNGTDDCAIPLVRDDGRLWFVDPSVRAPGAPANPRTAVESGDRLTIRCGAASTDVLFAHFKTHNGGRAHD